jgi:hypothetical protein
VSFQYFGRVCTQIPMVLIHENFGGGAPAPSAAGADSFRLRRLVVTTLCSCPRACESTEYLLKPMFGVKDLAHALHGLMALNCGGWQRAVGTPVGHWQLAGSWQRAAAAGISRAHIPTMLNVLSSSDAVKLRTLQEPELEPGGRGGEAAAAGGAVARAVRRAAGSVPRRAHAPGKVRNGSCCQHTCSCSGHVPIDLPSQRSLHGRTSSRYKVLTQHQPSLKPFPTYLPRAACPSQEPDAAQPGGVLAAMRRRPAVRRRAHLFADAAPARLLGPHRQGCAAFRVWGWPHCCIGIWQRRA